MELRFSEVVLIRLYLIHKNVSFLQKEPCGIPKKKEGAAATGDARTGSVARGSFWRRRARDAQPPPGLGFPFLLLHANQVTSTSIDGGSSTGGREGGGRQDGPPRGRRRVRDRPSREPTSCSSLGAAMVSPCGLVAEARPMLLAVTSKSRKVSPMTMSTNTTNHMVSNSYYFVKNWSTAN
ncbi:uncharacterized protein [Triticum aestivum]|uniref:uncharacterized protein n=1 Tax=Triticum aestivum TaxID=4565 RepID=UPI001D035A22|nr:uncharacterized protein LOC123055849 [Triticum aestivum]